MATKYSLVPPGNIFHAGGGSFRKIDDLYYEDTHTGFEAMWNPMFDDTIELSQDKKEVPPTNANKTDKFLVDPHTRMIKPNPNYRECDSIAEKVFAGMWGTAEFDCDPEDYDFIALQSVQSVMAIKSLAKVLQLEIGRQFPGKVPNIWAYNEIVKILTAAYKIYKTPVTAKKDIVIAKKTPVKKTPVKKTPVKKTPVKKTPVKKTPVKKTPVKKKAKK